MLNKFIIFLLFHVSLNMMIFPFNRVTLNKNGFITKDSPEYNGTHFAIDNFNTKLYTQMKIGNPFQKVKVLLSSETCAFKIGKSKHCIYDDEYLSFYNRNKSSDFTFTPLYSMTDQECYDEQGSTAEDTIYAYTDIKLENESQFKRVGFYLGSDTNDKLCGIIGLEMDNIICQRIYNIIKHSKSKEYIDNYKFMLKYKNINEGLFIIGGELKDVVENYDERKNFLTKLTTRAGIYKWGVEITKIILGEKNDTIDYNLPSEINNDLTFIVAGPQYFKHINESFFIEYFNKGICTINLYDNNPELRLSEKYNVIECIKDKFGKNDVSKFPNFHIYIGDYYKEKKFTLDYNDLFTENHYKYFFNIIFDKQPTSKIKLGKIFLKKYLVNFNLDSRMIEIYDENPQNYIDDNNQKGKDENKNDNINSNMYIYIIIALFAIIITGIAGYFLGKYLNKIRKRRANELVDVEEYEYTSETKNSINF